MLTAEQFHRLARVPAVVEWLANVISPKTRKAYRNHVGGFANFVGIADPEQFRHVTRAHLIAWRDSLTKAEASPARPDRMTISSKVA